MTAQERFISQAPVKPGAGVMTAIYTCPGGFEAALSSIIVCNDSATPTTFSLRFAKSGAADAPAQGLYSSQYIGGNETFIINLNKTLTQTDVIRGTSASGNCIFDVSGTEVQ